MRSWDLRRSRVAAAVVALLTFAAAEACDIESPAMREHMMHRPAHHAMAPASHTPCVDGMAGIYPCSNIDLLAFVPVSQFAASSTNSLWGWTDPDFGTEYALIGANNGIAFYDVSTPDAPRYLGKLPTTAGTGSSIWRDVRVYQNHAFVVSDSNPGHGMQVFDLTRLRDVTTPQTFTEDGHYSGFGIEPHDLDQRDDRFRFGRRRGHHLPRRFEPWRPADPRHPRSDLAAVRGLHQRCGLHARIAVLRLCRPRHRARRPRHLLRLERLERSHRDRRRHRQGRAAHAVIDSVQRQRLHAPELAHRRSEVSSARRRARRGRLRQQRAHVHLRRVRSRLYRCWSASTNIR